MRIINLILVIVLLSGCASLLTYNPATGRREFIFVSSAEEVAMGESMHSGLTREVKFSQDKEKTDRLERIGERVAQVADRQDYQYRFFLIEKDEMNAFTTPGGFIYMYTGLMDKLGTDDRIASVLAHEIGHSSARHIIKKFQAALGYDLLTNILMDRLGISGTAKAITDAGLNASMNIVFSAYGRKDEYEADRLAVKYMLLAGYQPSAVVETLQILDEEDGKDNIPLFVRTHPYLKDRIKAAQEEITVMKEKFD